MERALRTIDGLKHRQLTLLSHAVRHADAVYTFETHRRSHNVVYQTARNDLLHLEAMGFLDRQQVGREFRFHPAPGLPHMISNRRR